MISWMPLRGFWGLIRMEMNEDKAEKLFDNIMELLSKHNLGDAYLAIGNALVNLLVLDFRENKIDTEKGIENSIQTHADLMRLMYKKASSIMIEEINGK